MGHVAGRRTGRIGRDPGRDRRIDKETRPLRSKDGCGSIDLDKTDPLIGPRLRLTPLTLA